MPIEDFNDYFGTRIGNENFDTISGYIVKQIGHLPKQGEIVDIDFLKITIMVTNKQYIQLLRLT